MTKFRSFQFIQSSRRIIFRPGKSNPNGEYCCDLELYIFLSNGDGKKVTMTIEYKYPENCAKNDGDGSTRII